MIRVFIVAPSAESRSAWAAQLSADPRFQVIGGGPAVAAVEASWRANGKCPDVLVADSPEAATALLQRRSGHSPALVVLGEDWGRPEIRMAIRRGAAAILGRNSSPREIMAAIEAAAAGLTVLGAEEKDALLPSSSGGLHHSAELGAERLTEREAEVLALVAQGAGNKSIAARLGLSEHTVKFHVSSVLAKLGASSRTEAVAEGIRRGLVPV